MLTIKELSRKYDLGETTIRRWINENLLPCSVEIIKHKKITVVNEDSLRSLLLLRLGSIESIRKPQDAGKGTNDQLKDIKKHLSEIDRIINKIMNA